MVSLMFEDVRKKTFQLRRSAANFIRGKPNVILRLQGRTTARFQFYRSCPTNIWPVIGAVDKSLRSKGSAALTTDPPPASFSESVALGRAVG